MRSGLMPVYVHGITAPIDNHVPEVWLSGDRNHANGRLRGLLRLQGLRKDTEAAPRKLLCLLFVRLGPVSTNSRGCRALLHAATRPKLQEAATAHSNEGESK